MNQINSTHIISILNHLGYGGFAANVPENLGDAQILTNNDYLMTLERSNEGVSFCWQGPERPQLYRRATLALEGYTLTFTEFFAPRSYSERSHWRSLYAATHQGDDGLFECTVWGRLADQMALPVVIDMAGTSQLRVQDELQTADPTVWSWLDFSWPVVCVRPELWTNDPHLPMEITHEHPIGPWTSFGLIYEASCGRTTGAAMVTPFRRTKLEVAQ
jgi:hypothetical protein